MDYFLACAIVAVHTGGSQDEIKLLNQHMGANTQPWEQACVIALGLLDTINAAGFLKDLLRINTEISRLAFESLDYENALDISKVIISEMLNVDDGETDDIQQIAVALPYPAVVESLSSQFRFSAEENRTRIAEAISCMVIKYFSLLAPERPFDRALSYETRVELRKLDEALIIKATKRGVDLLNAWIGSKYDGVKFHAAKGLWEADRGTAATAMKDILLKGNSKIAHDVRCLMEEWGIE